ncbi:hypothetical protein [Bacillus paramycoides]|uniref:hypothetical protein n=1 Tax=Bacillus paramycoides TaxID=2026194 RepID=UPI002E1FF4C4|nr:hypothetical protein [Bacillus paramycoides]
MTMEIGRKIEHGLNQIVDTFMVAMMQRQERIQRENDYAQKLHQDIISKLENQFQNELQNRNLSVEYRGENYKFEKIDNGNLIFHSNNKKISIAANEIESSIKEKEPVHTKEQTNFNHPLDPSQNKTIETPIQKTENAPEVVSAKEIKIKSDQTFNDDTKENTGEKINFKDDKEQIRHMLNLLNGQEQKLMVQYANVMIESLNNHYADKSSYEESNKLEEMKKKCSPEQIERVNTVVKQNISSFGKVDGKVNVDKFHSILKEVQQEHTKENEKENIPEQPIEKNSLKNEAKEPSQNKTIETPIQKTENALEVPADIRGKLEAINMLKNMSSKEITDTIKESQKISSNENKPFGEVYKDKLIEKFESSITQSRKELVNKSEQIFNESSVVKEKINDGLDKINAALVQLENSQKHGLIPEGKYDELKSSLVGDRDKLTGQLDKVVGAEKKMENQLKYDLKSQFPDLKVAQLNAKQTLDIAKTACIATKRDLNSLKSFAKENKLENTMKAINKATKEVEVVVEKTVEVSINR